MPFHPSCAIFIHEVPPVEWFALLLPAGQGNNHPIQGNLDDQEYLMWRSFLAIEIPTTIQCTITEATASLQRALPRPFVMWITHGNLHLTLKFLGNATPEALERFSLRLKSEIGSQNPFALHLEGLGAYPSSRHARVIWIGIKAPLELSILHAKIETTAFEFGYQKEERSFSPHVTLGRVGRKTTDADLLNIHLLLGKMPQSRVGTFTVSNLSIFKSDLLPEGPVYTKIHTIPLSSIPA